MFSPLTRLPFAMVAAAFAFGIAGLVPAEAAAQSRAGAATDGAGLSPLVKVSERGGRYVCCRKGNRTWWMPSRRVCQSRNGHVVSDRACPEKCCVKPGRPPFVTRGACAGGTFGSMLRCRDSGVRKKTTTRGAQPRPPVALCCRKGTRRWKVSSKSACTRTGGHIVGMQLCRDSGVRKKSTTRGGPRPKGKPMPPRRGGGKPAGKPAPGGGKPTGDAHGKPTGIPPGCKPRYAATRAGAVSKQAARLAARAAWGAYARAKYGVGYSWRNAKGKKEKCWFKYGLANCKVSAYPCPR